MGNQKKPDFDLWHFSILSSSKVAFLNHEWNHYLHKSKKNLTLKALVWVINVVTAPRAVIQQHIDGEIVVASISPATTILDEGIQTMHQAW